MRSDCSNRPLLYPLSLEVLILKEIRQAEVLVFSSSHVLIPENFVPRAVLQI